MMLSSHFIGEISEQIAALAFLKLGYMVSKPLVQSSKYDFIVEINHNLYKIQVKTGQLKEESYILFATSTSHTNTKKTINLTYTSDDVDFFVVVCEDKCYMIPISDCHKRAQRLRIKPTNNSQVNGITFAKDYILEDMVKKI